ncbi:hypothetical protein DL769_006206 [Monosporascus sp. CRB-8-3]|nr:hypothetical protein DL769_006206 [Monosporascus sp. CRB-8-3]
MAEIAGLTLSVLGIAGLFKACVDNFDIVVRAREFSQEFEYLCTELAIHRTRLVLWGETLGIVQAEEGGGPVHYIRSLERPHIKPTVKSCLFQLCDLLRKADTISEHYSLNDGDPRKVSDSKGLAVLRDTFERIRERIHKNQKQKSVRKVTKWAVHDHARFKELVHKIGALLDGLEKILEALGRSEAYQSQFTREIESISDEDSLSLLEGVGSSVSAAPALKAISDTASMRRTILTSSSKSYKTAKTRQLDGTQEAERASVAHNGMRQAKLPWLTPRSRPQFAQPNTQDAAFDCITKGKPANEAPASSDDTLSRLVAEPNQQEQPHQSQAEATIDMPQHQRWMAALVARQSQIQRPLSFSESDVRYGEVLQPTKAHDDAVSQERSATLAIRASTGESLARRMFLELRNIRRANISFISAAPVGDSFDKLVASIEGPPGTPYEGGVFWIKVRLIDMSPPIMQFHTRIYHPNVDCTGRVCVDYTSWWEQVAALNHRAVGDNPVHWFSERITHHCSLGALLVALCGLLASPNLEDPLVPEIAEKYIMDYEGYCEDARRLTWRYARDGRPDEESIEFPTAHPGSKTHATPHITPEYRPKPLTRSMVNVEVKGIEDILKDEYDDERRFYWESWK